MLFEQVFNRLVQRTEIHQRKTKSQRQNKIEKNSSAIEKRCRCHTGLL